MIKWPWRSRSMTSIFNINREYHRMHAWCKFGDSSPNLGRVISRRQAEFPTIPSQNGQNDLEGQGQWPPFSIPAKGIPGCMFGANLVIPAQTCDELSCGRGKVYDRTDRQTDGRTDRRRQRQYPFGLKAKGKKRDHRMFINTMLLCYKSCLYLHFKPTSQEACRRSWSALRLSRRLIFPLLTTPGGVVNSDGVEAFHDTIS